MFQHGYDIDFLADQAGDCERIAREIALRCKQLHTEQKRQYSKRIFVVHGHDSGLKNELARLLECIGLVAVILHEQPDGGRTIFSKLTSALSDIG